MLPVVKGSGLDNAIQFECETPELLFKAKLDDNAIIIEQSRGIADDVLVINNRVLSLGLCIRCTRSILPDGPALVCVMQSSRTELL